MNKNRQQADESRRLAKALISTAIAQQELSEMLKEVGLSLWPAARRWPAMGRWMSPFAERRKLERRAAIERIEQRLARRRGHA